MEVVSKSPLIEQVAAEFDKAQRESVKARLKEIMARKSAAEKVVKLADAEISKLLHDYDKGLL
jgi:hypothetical protein